MSLHVSQKERGKTCMFCFLFPVSNPWLSVDLEMPFKKVAVWTPALPVGATIAV